VTPRLCRGMRSYHLPARRSGLLLETAMPPMVTAMPWHPSPVSPRLAPPRRFRDHRLVSDPALSIT
jgi:hypothetical protein